jgi:hypothetical protein
MSEFTADSNLNLCLYSLSVFIFLDIAEEMLILPRAKAALL